eukprot:766726-Hanusia_phi.AAC.1
MRGVRVGAQRGGSHERKRGRRDAHGALQVLRKGEAGPFAGKIVNDVKTADDVCKILGLEVRAASLN